MFIQIVFLSLSLILTILFFFYGFNQYYLLNRARKYRIPDHISAPGYRPSVAIHLPIYNERYVIRRLVAACARMAEAYGIDSVRIVVIDDSDDDTVDVVDDVVKEYQGKHYQLEILRRDSRQGFKAGALQAALDRSNEEFIAIFDADFTPPADFLLNTIPHFLQHETLGIIQSRWVHINREYNALTKAIALGIDVHFLVDQAGRYAAGCFQNFNGSGGIIRRKALVEAGGWQADTLAEDLDVSYRIQLQGYRILYLKNVQSPGEIPPTVPSYKKQQARWANGSLRTARKLLPALLLKRDLGIKKRLQSFIHLTSYLVHPLMLSSYLLACLASLFQINILHIVTLKDLRSFTYGVQTGTTIGVSVLPYLAWGMIGLLIVLCTVSAWITPIAALKTQGFPVSRNISSLLILYLLGCGVSMSNTIEAGKALLTNRSWAFKRTPKYAIQKGMGEWKNKRYQVPLDAVCLLEFALVCLGMAAILQAILRSNLGALLILVPYTSAYAFVFLLTIWESRNSERR